MEEENEEIYEYEPWVTDLIKLINDNKQILLDDAKKDTKQQKYKIIKKIFEYRPDRVANIITDGLIDYDGKTTLTKNEYAKAEKIASNMNENMKLLAKEQKMATVFTNIKPLPVTMSYLLKILIFPRKVQILH